MLDISHEKLEIIVLLWCCCFQTTHHQYYRYETAYYLIGPLQIHYGIYWLQQMLEPDYLRAVFACTAALNKLELSRVEAFLLLAIAMFTPGLNIIICPLENQLLYRE